MPRIQQAHVVPTRKPLLTVCDMLATDHDAHSTAEGSWTEHCKNGDVINFVRRGGKFETDAEVRFQCGSRCRVAYNLLDDACFMGENQELENQTLTTLNLATPRLNQLEVPLRTHTDKFTRLKEGDVVLCAVIEKACVA